MSVHIIFHCTWVRCKKEIIKTNTCVQELQLAARVFVLGCSHLPPFFCCCCYISLAFGGGTLHFHLERSLIENTFNRRRNIRRNHKIALISVATGTSLSFTFQHPNSNKLTKKKLSLSYMNSPAHHQLNLFYHMFAYFSLFFLFPHHVFDWLCFRLLRRFCHTLKNKKKNTTKFITKSRHRHRHPRVWPTNQPEPRNLNLNLYRCHTCSCRTVPVLSCRRMPRGRSRTPTRASGGWSSWTIRPRSSRAVRSGELKLLESHDL